MKKMEILAPAGNIESLKAAVLYGADAVYFGLSDFNARIKADNFNFDNLGEWVDFCHFYDVKVYITLNTIIKEDELERLALFVRQAVLRNVDAFIVTDLATVELCKKIAPSIPLHFSTQFGIHNLEGTKYACSLGAGRIILSRETPISEIKRIKDNLDVEIEAFVHGALCVGFSGNCYMSSMIDGNSGNRGRCKQPCRKLYDSSLSGEGYYLSTNDLCLISELETLSELGVASLKIEGRLKSAEYVASAVYAYKKALCGDKSEKHVDRIKSSYSRTLTKEGYLYGKNHGIINPRIQNSVGLSIGEVVRVSKLNNGLNKIDFLSSKKLSKNTGIKFIDKGREVGGATLTTGCDNKGNYTAYTKAPVRVGCMVSITQAVGVMDEMIPRTLEVDVELREIAYGEYLLKIFNDTVSSELKFDLDSNNLSQKEDQTAGVADVLRKGSEPYCVREACVDVKSRVLIPFSVLNKKRKECFLRFKSAQLEKYKKDEPVTCIEDVKIDRQVVENRNLAIIVSDLRQLKSKIYDLADEVIVYPYEWREEYITSLLGEVLTRGDKKVYLGIPTIMRQKDIKVLYKTIEKYNTLRGLYGNNPALITIADKYGLEKFFGHGFNVANKIAFNKLSGKVVLSAELSRDELNKLNNEDSYVYALGYFPLMSLAHCPNIANGKNCADCVFERGENIIYSNSLDKFTIRRIKIDSCYFELYNGVLTSLLDKDLKQNLLLDLRNLSNEEIEALSRLDKGAVSFEKSTSGRYQRGVL